MERCMHILPHHHDTGGFFVAVFTKVAKYPDAGGIKRPRQEGKGAADPSAKAASEQADATSQDVSCSNACNTLTSGISPSLLLALHFEHTQTWPCNNMQYGIAGGQYTEFLNLACVRPLLPHQRVIHQAQILSRPLQTRTLSCYLQMANPPAAQGIRLTCLNPVAKVSDAQLLSRICDFYGVQPEFPLRMQTITRQDCSQSNAILSMADAKM